MLNKEHFRRLMTIFWFILIASFTAAVTEGLAACGQVTNLMPGDWQISPESINGNGSFTVDKNGNFCWNTFSLGVSLSQTCFDIYGMNVAGANLTIDSMEVGSEYIYINQGGIFYDYGYAFNYTIEIAAYNIPQGATEFSGTITVSASGPGVCSGGREYSFTATCVRPLPALDVSPTSLSNSCEQGQNAPSQTFRVGNTGGGTLSYTILDSADWMSVTPAGGSLAGGVYNTITVNYATSAMTAGTYDGFIQVTDSRYPSNPVDVWVNLTVLASTPTIAVSPATLTPACLQGQNPAAQSFEVWNAGIGAINYTISGNAAWLSCTPASGSSTGGHNAVTVNYDAAGLVAGTYNAAINITDAGAANSPQTIPVTLTVEKGPTIAVSPASLTPSCYNGGIATSQTFELWNEGPGTLNYSISENATWLSCTPASGSSTGGRNTITVDYLTGGLTVGTYNAAITITAEGAANSPRTIPISLKVYSNPIIYYDPEYLIIPSQQGQNAAARTFDLWVSSGSILNYSISTNASWLACTPSSGSTTGERDTIAVNFNTAGLSSGTYNATINISAAMGGWGREIPVSLFVTPYMTGEKWSFPTGMYVPGSVALGADGSIYFGADGKIYALSPGGTKKWEFKTGYYGLPIPTIGNDGTIYSGSTDNQLYALSPAGVKKWAFATGGEVGSPPAIGADGTVYVGSADNNLYAVNPDGTKKWEFLTGDYYVYSPVIGTDGTVYFGAGDSKLYALNPDGTKKWDFNAYVSASPALGTDGTIYFGAEDSKIYALNPDGSKKWEFITGAWIGASPAIGADGTVYVASMDGKLYALNPDGTQKWSYDIRGGHSSPAIGTDGVIYVGGRYGLNAFAPEGTLMWVCNLGNLSVESSPAIGADGTIYVGCGSVNNETNVWTGKHYALYSSSAGLAKSPWPRFQHDNQNTGRYGAKTPSRTKGMGGMLNLLLLD